MIFKEWWRASDSPAVSLELSPREQFEKCWDDAQRDVWSNIADSDIKGIAKAAWMARVEEALETKDSQFLKDQIEQLDFWKELVVRMQQRCEEGLSNES